MAKADLHVVTGAFGYSSSHIAAALLEEGKRVRTVTGHPDRQHPLNDGRIEVAPLAFDDPERLTASLEGASVLYNTYWIRFARGRMDHGRAVEHSKTLVRAAVEAGVQRLVHVSITKPSIDSHLPYFRGKAEVERAIRESGLSYAILRPTVFFGGRDVLINNIAWLLRRFPFFGVAPGRYGLQPVHVDDFAGLAVRQGAGREDVVLDAVGPEVYPFRDLVKTIARAIGRRAWVVRMPRPVLLAAARIIGRRMHDTVLTADEVDGLRANLLISDDPATCTTRFSEWLREHAEELGRTYASEIDRHFR